MAVVNPSVELRPLQTWEELVGWREPSPPVEVVVSVAKLQPRTPSISPSHLKTLLCHDMMGGYLDDRYYHGTSNQDAYRFYHWSGVDTFVYFSHKMATVPPPAWVNAAHLHGVKVLGTFITESKHGVVICNNLLASEASVSTAASQLVRIARYHGFEGWLLNIENPIDPKKIYLMVEFARKLTVEMKKMSADAEVIWYDSITQEGKLHWQNELNKKNKPFYQVCDGIFINYSWTAENLDTSRREAGDRAAATVYVGVDMFGRNFYEGGKFNTWKALKLVRSHGLSAAIFAQGWTYENQDDFVIAERKMWSALAPYLTHHGPAHLPLATSFCQGHGYNFYVGGKVASKFHWHNLSKQQLQPLWSQEGKGMELSLVSSEAFSGGGCLGVTMTTPGDVRLFVCGLRWREALLVSVWYKWKGPVVPFSLLIHLHSTSTTGNTASHRMVELECEDETPQTGKETCSSEPGTRNNKRRKEVGATATQPHKRLRKSTTTRGAALTSTCVQNGWTHKSFSVSEDEGWELRQIDVRMGAPSTLLLGYFELTDINTKG